MNWILRLVVIVVLLAGSTYCQAQDIEATAAEPPKPDNSAALTALVRLTRDQDANVRMIAFSAIGRIGEETPDVVAAIQSGLKDDDSRVRVESFFALTSSVSDGKVKVEALLLIIQDENEELAIQASEQMGRLGKPAVPHLVEALQNEKIRNLILRTLGSMGTNARESIPALTELLKSDDATLRARVATCLGEICDPRPPRRSTQGLASSARSRSPDAATMARMLDAIWPRYDTDGDGVLSPDEQAGIRTLEASADTNGDKNVSRAEFSRWYTTRIRERNSGRSSPRGIPPAGAFGGRRP